MQWRCLPAPRLHPPKPSRIPTRVVRLETEAACELGMPPVSTNRRRFQCRVCAKSLNPLKPWISRLTVSASQNGSVVASPL